MIYIVTKVDDISEFDEALISRLMLAVEIDKYEIINIKFFRLKDKNSFHICLGEAAYQATKLFVEKLDKLIKVSDLNKLYDTEANEKSRAETYHLLKNLNQHIKLISINTSVNPVILTNISSINLNNLKQELINNNISGFTVLDSMGKKIRIHLNQSDLIKEDINISIEELVTLKLIHEVFNTDSSIIINKGEKSK